MEGKPTKGPGKTLQEERLKQKQDLSNAASYLGISESLLQALESDQFDYPLLQDKSLVQKYYSQYARFLDISADMILSRYDDCLTQNEFNQNSPSTSGVFKKISWVMAFALIFGAAELLYWGKHKVVSVPEPIVAQTDESQEQKKQKSLEYSINEMVMSELQAEELEITAQSD